MNRAERPIRVISPENRFPPPIKSGRHSTEDALFPALDSRQRPQDDRKNVDENQRDDELAGDPAGPVADPPMFEDAVEAAAHLRDGLMAWRAHGASRFDPEVDPNEPAPLATDCTVFAGARSAIDMALAPKICPMQGSIAAARPRRLEGNQKR